MTGRRGRGRPRKSAADRNDQRRRIVESARTTIGAHGPSTSIGDIAAAAGVSKPLIYETFGDKAGLADAIAADLVAELIDDMHDLSTGIDRFTQFMVAEPRLYRFLVQSIRSGGTELTQVPLVTASSRSPSESCSSESCSSESCSSESCPEEPSVVGTGAVEPGVDGSGFDEPELDERGVGEPVPLPLRAAAVAGTTGGAVVTEAGSGTGLPFSSTYMVTTTGSATVVGTATVDVEVVVATGSKVPGPLCASLFMIPRFRPTARVVAATVAVTPPAMAIAVLRFMTSSSG